jgi:hypothetical protein
MIKLKDILKEAIDLTVKNNYVNSDNELDFEQIKDEIIKKNNNKLPIK